ncbi:TIGR02234 family membrane protein [Streptomyces winkii]|uniref:TIGR02234 family membrane protein n=1 Tax=Streptomyces winkii TaxID=3051178 RepID=UPI0028D34E58|nr:TIGR02234 family membrane protein [Streptomyces sp. DSM 40971]
MTSVPQARSSDPEQGDEGRAGQPAPSASAAGEARTQAHGARARAARRALAPALLCGAAGAALALLADGQVWSHATASFAQGGLPVKAEGGDVTGLPSALALVGLAALVAVFAVRRAGRVLVAALLALCGTGTLAAGLLGADGTDALKQKAAEASGLARTGIEAVHVSAWPYVSAGGGALLLLAGVLALRYGPAWPSMSGSTRYERTERPSRRPRGGAGAPVDPDRPEDLWKALDRGEDPTGGLTEGAPARADGAREGSA